MYWGQLLYQCLYEQYSPALNLVSIPLPVRTIIILMVHKHYSAAGGAQFYLTPRRAPPKNRELGRQISNCLLISNAHEDKIIVLYRRFFFSRSCARSQKIWQKWALTPSPLQKYTLYYNYKNKFKKLRKLELSILLIWKKIFYEKWVSL